MRDNRFLSYLNIHLQSGERSALEWIAGSIGVLYSENEKLRKELASVKRRLTNLQKKLK